MNINKQKHQIVCLLLALLSLNSINAITSVSRGNNEIVLKNDKVELRFDDKNIFLLKSFTQTGVNILPSSGSSTYIWELTYRGKNGENPVLKSTQGDYKGCEVEKGENAISLVFTWNMVLKKQNEFFPVRVKVSLKDNSELPEWNISASLPDEWTITNSEFPRIAVNHFNGAKAILPVGFGTEYTIGNNGQLQSCYPSGTGTMQLIMMYGKEGTIYFSSLDKEGSGKKFYLKSEDGNVIFIQQVITSYGWSIDNTFSLPWNTVLAFNKNSWEATALKWYRPFTFNTSWGSKKINERKIADWVKNSNLWLRPMGVSDKTVNALNDALKFYGTGVGLHWYYWHNEAFDTNYPNYFPEKKGFRDMVHKAQSMGAYVTPYINGRLWDPATDNYQEGGVEASCRKPDGTLYTEVYGSKVLNTVTCPASDTWQSVISKLNARILKDLNANGVYMDQIGCANCEPCYAINHHHAQGGGSWWVNSYRKLLTDMRNDIYNNRQAMTTEENAECYIDLFDMMLTVNSPHNSYTKMVPLFPLIYSDRCIYSGFTYIPWKLNDGSFKYITAKSLLWGSQLGWVDPETIMNENFKIEKEFLKNITAFRKRNHDIFLGGRFLGNIPLEGDIPILNIPNYESAKTVLGAEWETVKGERTIIIINFGNQDQDIILPSGKKMQIKALSALRQKEK